MVRYGLVEVSDTSAALQISRPPSGSDIHTVGSGSGVRDRLLRELERAKSETASDLSPSTRSIPHSPSRVVSGISQPIDSPSIRESMDRRLQAVQEFEQPAVHPQVVNSDSERDSQLMDMAVKFKSDLSLIHSQIQRSYADRLQSQRAILKDTLAVAYEREMELDRLRREQMDREKAEQMRRLAKEKAEKDAAVVAEEERKRLALAEESRLQMEKKLAEESAIKKRKDEEELRAREKAESAAKVDDSVSFGRPESIERARVLIAKVAHVKQNIDSTIKRNKAMMTEALRYRMQFTTKVGAVTNSKRHILQFSMDIRGILDKGKSVSADLLYPWLLNNLAKQFVKQAETEIGANLSKAFPLAYLLSILCVYHGELMEYTLGRLMKKCIYIIPQYPKREVGETENQLRVKMGYKKDLSENEFQFHERMKGLVAFYGAITQTNLSQLASQTGQSRIGDAWLYLAQFLNMTPRKISPILLEIFLQTCGHALLAAYPNQMRKVMDYIRREYVPRMKSVAGEGSAVRMELLLDGYDRAGRRLSAHDGSQLKP
eukprot:Partr_v1_DN26461_c0_g1_i1_m23978 putative GLE1 RNA export mediator homolog (yeast)